MTLPILIAHRGNVTGPKPESENDPEYLRAALEMGYDVECDVELSASGVRWFLNHEGNPKIYTLDDPRDLARGAYRQRVWFHAQDPRTLMKLAEIGLRGFFHTGEDVVMTTTGDFWFYPGKEPSFGGTKVVQVLNSDTVSGANLNAAAICSDYVDDIYHRYYLTGENL